MQFRKYSPPLNLKFSVLISFLLMTSCYNKVNSYAVGLKHYNNGNYLKASVEFSNAINEGSYLAKSYYYRGMSYKKLNNEKYAVQDFNISIKLDSTSSESYMARAKSNIVLKNYKEAISDYSKAIKILSKENLRGNPAILSKAYNSRGYAKFRLGNSEEALMDCNTSLNFDSLNNLALFNLGIIMFKEGNTNLSCSYFLKSIDAGNIDAKKEYEEKCLK